MRGKHRGRKRVRRTKHPCELGWRVRWSRDFRQYFMERGVWREVRKFLKDLERRLRRDASGTLSKLRREPIIAHVVSEGKERPLRRLRLYVKGVGFRLGFIIRHDTCRVWFLLAEKRDEETYKKFRRRFGKK